MMILRLSFSIIFIFLTVIFKFDLKTKIISTLHNRKYKVVSKFDFRSEKKKRVLTVKHKISGIKRPSTRPSS